MKKLIKLVIPVRLLSFYRRFKRSRMQRFNATRCNQRIFAEIYEKGSWGSGQDEFYSGDGSSSDVIAETWLESLGLLAQKHGFKNLSVVDIGCGDFRIGHRFCSLFKHYTGVDVVPDLITAHQAKHASDHVCFSCLDIVKDNLPAADVCVIRQVLQHLSNAQILTILGKLRSYRYVVVTEHLPTPNEAMIKNLDKPPGEDIRIFDNSGVFLSAPPFSIPEHQISIISETVGHGFRDYPDPGIIQTILYCPKSKPE